jgi:hypothetical protein
VTDIRPFLAIDERYGDDEAETRLLAQILEAIRQYAADAALCDDCVRKLTGPFLRQPPVKRRRSPSR